MKGVALSNSNLLSSYSNGRNIYIYVYALYKSKAPFSLIFVSYIYTIKGAAQSSIRHATPQENCSLPMRPPLTPDMASIYSASTDAMGHHIPELRETGETCLQEYLNIELPLRVVLDCCKVCHIYTKYP